MKITVGKEQCAETIACRTTVNRSGTLPYIAMHELAYLCPDSSHM